MKKAVSFIIFMVLFASVLFGCQAKVAPVSEQSAAVTPTPGETVIGIAWREDTDSEFFTNLCKAVEAAGGSWVMLEQVRSADLAYDQEDRLTEGVTPLGMLDEAAVKKVHINDWQDSNAGEAVGDVSLVLFTGGEDISPSLLYSPEPWYDNAEDTDFNAERDVSDYLTMTYCLDHEEQAVILSESEESRL